jgi:hypothetical protein
VIRAGGVGIHARAALDRFQAGEDFDIGGVVSATHVAGGDALVEKSGLFGAADGRR